MFVTLLVDLSPRKEITQVLSKSKRNRRLMKLITWLYGSCFFWLSFAANVLMHFVASGATPPLQLKIIGVNEPLSI